MHVLEVRRTLTFLCNQFLELFSSWKTQTLYRLNNTSTVAAPQAPEPTILRSVFRNSTTLGPHIFETFRSCPFVTQHKVPVVHPCGPMCAISFLLKSESWYSVAQTWHIVYHSSVDGHLGFIPWFGYLWIMSLWTWEHEYRFCRDIFCLWSSQVVSEYLMNPCHDSSSIWNKHPRSPETQVVSPGGSIASYFIK